MAPPVKKQYRPPQPDCNTFNTQREFLESLQPVPLDSVKKTDRRCAHCWKHYGESDPGLENAEDPVRLRCGHVFGEKCMKELFGPPETIKVNLNPLSFAPGARGAELGRRLSAYVDQCGVEKGALLIGGRREKDFTRLLNEAQNANRGFEILGNEWYPLIQQAMYPRHNTLDIHVLENAVIFDVAMPEVKERKSPPLAPHTLPSGPFLVQSNQASTEELLDLADQAQQLYEAAKKASSDTSSNSSSTASVSGSKDITLPPLSSFWPSDTLFLQPQSGHVTFSASSSGDSLKKDDANSDIIGPGSKLVNMLSMFKSHLPTSDSTEQSTATDSSKKVAEMTSKLLEQDSKLMEMMSTLEDPILAMVSPSFVAYQNMMEKYGSKTGSLPHSTEKGNEPMQGIEMAFSGAGYNALPNDHEGLKEALTLTHAQENTPGTWKDELPKQSNLDKLVALQKSQEEAKKALKAAHKAEDAKKAAKQAAQKRAAKAKEERDTRRKDLIAILARTFTRIYDDYEQHQFNTALAAGKPPPVKKLKLASNNGPSTPATAGLPAPVPPPQNVIHVSAVVHERDLDAKHLEVPQPYIYDAESDYGDDEEDTEGTEGTEDTVDTVTDEIPAPGISDKTIFLTRVMCSTTCCKPPSGASRSLCALPEKICWKDIKKVPDGCPICQKVLFKKEEKVLSPREATYAGLLY